MAQITVEIPDELLKNVQCLIQTERISLDEAVCDALLDFVASTSPPAKINRKLEALLEEGLNSPLIRVDEQFWQRMRAEFLERQARRKVGQS